MRKYLAPWLAASLFPAALAASPPGPDLPEWLSGCWREEAADRVTEECWTAPHGDMMAGSGISALDGKLITWEAMRVARGEDGGLIFVASPRGERPVVFRLRADVTPGLAFYNLENDYPQRVRYWRQGKVLNAEISMADGSKPMRWTYRRKR